jgi:hypothetical protein
MNSLPPFFVFASVFVNLWNFKVVALRPTSMAWLILHIRKALNKKPKNLIPAMNYIYRVAQNKEE